jgi:glycerol-3-phosphate acyltransferase PlsY
MLAIIAVVIAYLLGAIPFGMIVARLYGIGDIRTLGSGNIGATNVWRVAGARAAIWVYLGDIAKGIAAVMVGRYLAQHFQPALLPIDTFLVLCALATVLGHVFPVYLGFKGGKGVNTALGTMLVLLPVATIISFALFLIVLVLARYVSLGSILAAVCLFVVVVAQKYLLEVALADIYVYLTGALMLLIVFTHRKNISRLLAGTENRFSFSSKSRQDRSDG